MGVTFVYLLIDKTESAGIKFGVIGSIVGLLLDGQLSLFMS